MFQNIESVAYYIIKILNDESIQITHLKLQKLLYFLQKSFLINQNRPLFNEKFEAWVHGPVSPIIYKKFAEYGWDSIPYQTHGFLSNFFALNSEVKYLINEYIKPYKHLSGKELEELSHEEYAWLKARNGYPYHVPSNKTVENEDIIKS